MSDDEESSDDESLSLMDVEELKESGLLKAVFESSCAEASQFVL